MANISRCFAQYHDFNNSIFFQEKKGKVEVTIYDMASKIIHSSQVSEDILDGMMRDKENEGNVKANISKLLEMGCKPKFDEALKNVFFAKDAAAKEVDYSSVNKSVEDAIALLEPKASFEPSESSSYTCPITHMLLKDPVIDEHGHTYERENIESWVRVNHTCPLEGKPMALGDLKPNYHLIGIMEEVRRTKFAVPTKNLFTGTKEKVAQSFLDQGKLLENEGQYDEALESYRKALGYTDKARDYQYIPAILERKGDSLSAALAYLYLAKYQIEENDHGKALESLLKARDLDPDDIELNKPIALFYKENGRGREAFDLFMEIGARLAGKKDEMASMQALEAYKNALAIDPDFKEAYLKLADQIQEKQQKANVFLTAANHFMKKDVVLAEKLATTAYELAPENPLNYFPHIQALKTQKKTDELVNAYLNLSNVYKVIKDKKNKRLCLREMVELKPSGQIYERITKSYLKSGKNEKSLQYFLKWIDHCISEKKWNGAETIAQRALCFFKEDVNILARLEEIYNNFLTEHLHSLHISLARAYIQIKRTDLAKKSFKKAWERFGDFDAYFEVANIYSNNENYTKAVKILFELCKHAFFKENIVFLNKCVEAIFRIDHSLNLLTSDQKITFLTFTQISKLTTQVKELTRRLDYRECRGLSKSCAIGDVEHLDRMVNKIKDPEKIKQIIESPNENNLNLLQIAVINDQFEVAKKLIDILKTDVSIPINPDSDHELAGLTPLDIAAKNGNIELVELLLKAGAKESKNKNALHFSVENGSIDIVRVLLSYNLLVNLREPNNLHSPLHLAVLNKRLGITKLLLSFANIDPRLLDNQGYNPLYYAVQKSLPDFVRVICEAKNIKVSMDELRVLAELNKSNLTDENKEIVEEIDEILTQASKNLKLEGEE